MLLPPFECCCSDEHGDEFWPSRPVSCAGHGRRPAQPSPFPAGLGGAGRRPHRPHSHWNHVYLQPGTRLPPRRSPGSSLLKREDRHRHQRCRPRQTFVSLQQLLSHWNSSSCTDVTDGFISKTFLSFCWNSGFSLWPFYLYSDEQHE